MIINTVLHIKICVPKICRRASGPGSPNSRCPDLKIDFCKNSAVGPKDIHEKKYRGARDLSIAKFSPLCDPWRSKNRDLKFLRMYGVLKNIEFAFLAELRFFGRHVPHESRPKDLLIAKNENKTFYFSNFSDREKSEFAFFEDLSQSLYTHESISVV